MKQRWAIQILKLCSLILLSNTATSLEIEDEPPTVKVDVFAKHKGNRIEYNYRVINDLPETIDSVIIGGYIEQGEMTNADVRESIEAKELVEAVELIEAEESIEADELINVWELLELPSGWHPKLGIPSASSDSPMGWRISLSSSEDGEAHAIVWKARNDRSPLLLGGHRLGRMRVSLDQSDNSYLNSYATVHFTDREPATLTVPINQLDDIPPALIVSMVPDTLRSPEGKLMPVNTVFTVKYDYFDQLPAIKLESITANEMLGYGDITDASFGIDDRYIKLRAHHNDTADRIYTVIYSATDASGNQTLASATVTVPYDPPVEMQLTPFPEQVETMQIPDTQDQSDETHSEILHDEYESLSP